MPSNTPNVNLYKKNPATDGLDSFNIDTILNGNWDILDLLIGALLNSTTTYADDTGAANAYVIAVNSNIKAYAAGQTFHFKVKLTNTGASTLNVNNLGVKPIKIGSGASLKDPNAGDLQIGQIVTVKYDGTNFQLAPTNDLISTKLSKAGDTINGVLLLLNNIGLQGKAVDGSARNLALIAADDKAILGSTYNPMQLNSSATPTFNNGTVYNIWTDKDGGKVLATNGYQKLPSGLILQWGYNTAVASGATITFPIAFTTACYVVFPQLWGSSSEAHGTSTVVASFVVNHSAGGTANVQWFAIGR